MSTTVITEPPLTPSAPSICPPGLEYLTTVDQLVIQQQSDIFQNFVGYEKYNKYVAKNVLGQFVYLFAEDSGCCKRWFCCTRRCFEMKVMDYRNVEVMRFVRPLRCDYCCAFCCLQYIEVQGTAHSHHSVPVPGLVALLSFVHGLRSPVQSHDLHRRPVLHADFLLLLGSQVRGKRSPRSQ
ncbi:hypothetical protein MTO96_049184 [Rhipicephalus appendiculatus]